MDDLIALAERCEAAAGADQTLDSNIADALSEWTNLGGWTRRHNVSGVVERYSYVEAPAFTASLDAAMTLVPEGHDAQVNLYFGREGEGAAVVSHLKRINLPRTFAATPALALTAASLRARAAALKREE